MRHDMYNYSSVIQDKTTITGPGLVLLALISIGSIHICTITTCENVCMMYLHHRRRDCRCREGKKKKESFIRSPADLNSHKFTRFENRRILECPNFSNTILRQLANIIAYVILRFGISPHSPSHLALQFHHNCKSHPQ